MTGYGKATAELPEKKINVEIKSLNSKAMDLSTLGALFFLDPQAEIYFSALQNLGNLVTDFYFFFTISRGDASG